MNPPKQASRLCYCLRYHDAPAAIAFLERAFGFERSLVVPGDSEGQIAHAQLLLGEAMVMLGSERDEGREFDATQIAPRETGGRVTASAYVMIWDVDAHHDRARAAGAKILVAPEDQSYGGRMYMCRDLEGHVWSFGSYDPWAPAE